MNKPVLFGTLGPACLREDILTAMVAAGMGGLRVNLSHTDLDRCVPALDQVRRAAKGRELLLLADLQGPELRVGTAGLPLELRRGETLPLSALALPADLGPLEPGQILLLDDRKLQVAVLPGSQCRVDRGGRLLPRKSLAIPGMEENLPPLTLRDRANLALAPKLGVTGVMQPFVRGRADLLAVRQALDGCGGAGIAIFAKVENRRGLETLPEWIDLADWVVVARGDLGSHLPLARLPAVQKEIAALCARHQTPFVVATQLLSSMEQSATPTRAEVSDIFHAVLDGASGLMLTGETAAGRYPAEAMAVLREVSREAAAYLTETEKEGRPQWIISK